MDFQYSPGLAGYGAKGSDGSTGLQGLAIYFTDFDAIFNKIQIEYALSNNYVLWSIAPPETSLPENRSYINGDQFVTSDGNVYVINADSTFTYAGKFLENPLFEYSGYPSDDFERWRNNLDPSLSSWYIIDNVLSSKPVYHYDTAKIYGILARNYTRVEYTNLNKSGNNVFSVYSAGIIPIDEDNKALAIVRDITSNTFRIGNLDFFNKTTNTNLIFDVSCLIHNRNNPDYFKGDTSSLVLTNIDHNSPELYSGFDGSSGYLTVTPSTTSAQITWDLNNFTPFLNNKVSADLCLFESPVSVEVYSPSTSPTIILHEIDEAGTVTISGLTSATLYKFYISLYKDGWERKTEIKSFTTS